MTLKTLILSLTFTISTFAEKKPDIVIVIGDDHGVYHSSAYGSPEFHTPNMQFLADNGMKFNKAYIASPSCAPSRAALFTGLMPYNNGIVGNHEKKLKPGVKSLIPKFIQQGYDVVFAGKVAHMNEVAPYWVDDIQDLSGGTKPLGLNKVEKYLANKDKPVLLILGCKWPHRPWPNATTARIKPSEVKIPEKTFDTPETRSELTRYVEAVEGVDRTIGQTRDLIKKYLDPENTLLMYTADHGQAWPFGKWSLYEAGVRTPILVMWPKKIQKGVTSEAMVSWIDLIPTLVDIAGGETSKEIDGKSFRGILEGKDTEHRDKIFVTHKGDTNKNVYPCRSVRVGNFKYIYNLYPDLYYTTHMDLIKKKTAITNLNWASWVKAAQTNPEAAAFLRAYHSRPKEELYNLSTDLHEKVNLATNPEYKEKLSELRKLVKERMETVGDDKSLSAKPRYLKDFQLP
ncbi:MAG: sulfatase [Lentisphaeraceae bacterium]|nr:sulfatase [Lentisphaeraceae bacterium]